MVKLRLGRRTVMVGAVSAILLGLIAVGVVGALGIVGWEYTNSNQFCASMCHSVHPEESANHATRRTRGSTASSATWAARPRCT